MLASGNLQESWLLILPGVLGDPESVAGEYGRHSLYKMLGYFSLVGLLRLHSLLGDYYQAIKVLENIELNKKVDYCFCVIVFFPSRCKSTLLSALPYTCCSAPLRVCTRVCQSARSPPTTTWVSPTWWWGAIRMPSESLQTSCCTSRGPETCSSAPPTNMRWSVSAGLLKHFNENIPLHFVKKQANK